MDGFHDTRVSARTDEEFDETLAEFVEENDETLRRLSDVPLSSACRRGDCHVAVGALPVDEETQPGTDKIRAPWTTQQVDALNRYQASGLMHPFTCRGEHPEGRPALIAQHDGWLCPDPRCGVSQDWAHAWMAEAADEGTRQEGLINMRVDDARITP